VVLTISDHLAWDSIGHLALLEGKLNTYLRFIEGGELLDTYPQARNRQAVINVIAQFPLSVDAKKFFDRATAIVSGAGIGLRFQLLDK